MTSKILLERRHTVNKIIVNHIETAKKNKKLFDHANNIKSYDNQSINRTKQIAREFLEEYLHVSTFHGVKYLGNLRIKSSFIGKFFWVLTMICSFAFLCWMINTFWIRYTADPIRTVIESFQAPIAMIPFPAVTLCPLVPPLATRRRDLLQRMRLPYNMSNETAMFLFKYGHAFSNERVPGGKDYLNNLKTLLKLNHMTLIDFVKYLRPCEDLMESCWWDGIKTNCSDLFNTSQTYSGVCCSFNYLLEESIEAGRSVRTREDFEYLRTASFGPTSGLTIVLHPDLLVENDDTGNIIRFSTNSIGILVHCHHPLEYIGAIATRHLLQAQQELRLAVTPFVKKKLPGYYRRNIYGELNPYCEDVENTLKYFPAYRYSNCFISCSIESALKLCFCVPFYYEHIALKYSLRICDWEDFACLYANADKIRIIHEIDDGNFTCKCQTPCTNLYYEAQSSTGVLNRQDFNVSPIHKNLTSAQAILKVYMKYESFSIMDTIPIADEIYLLASVGGIFSLFVGCSFISAVELFYFIGLFLYSYYNSKKSK